MKRKEYTIRGLFGRTIKMNIIWGCITTIPAFMVCCSSTCIGWGGKYGRLARACPSLRASSSGIPPKPSVRSLFDRGSTGKWGCRFLIDRHMSKQRCQWVPFRWDLDLSSSNLWHTGLLRWGSNANGRAYDAPTIDLDRDSQQQRWHNRSDSQWRRWPRSICLSFLGFLWRRGGCLCQLRWFLQLETWWVIWHCMEDWECHCSESAFNRGRIRLSFCLNRCKAYFNTLSGVASWSSSSCTPHPLVFCSSPASSECWARYSDAP